MYRIGWLLVGLGVLLLFTRGGFGFFFFPLLFLPLLWLLFFGIFGRGRRPYGYGWAGPRHGWHGYDRGRCAGDGPRDERAEPEAAAKPEQRSYTGETTQL
jgi:hypothetical protein